MSGCSDDIEFLMAVIERQQIEIDRLHAGLTATRDGVFIVPGVRLYEVNQQTRSVRPVWACDAVHANGDATCEHDNLFPAYRVKISRCFLDMRLADKAIGRKR